MLIDTFKYVDKQKQILNIKTNLRFRMFQLNEIGNTLLYNTFSATNKICFKE